MRRQLGVFSVLLAVLAGCGSSKPQVKASGTTTTAGQASTTAPPSTTPQALANWAVYHGSAGRAGLDTTSPRLGQPKRLWAVSVRGNVYAEPLIVGNTVVVATEDDTVAAFNATTGHQLWMTSLGQPVNGDRLPCGNINPSGITGTPAIDTSTNTIWVAANVTPGQHLLFGISLSTGAVQSKRPLDPPGQDPRTAQQRGALALLGGEVYVPFGGLYGDCGDYHGYVVGLSENGHGTQSLFKTPNARSGIWAPGGPTITPNGDLLVTTGNSTRSSTSPFSGGDAVYSLSPALDSVGFFAPRNFADLDSSDMDLGSTSPALVGPDLIFQVGKQGVGYLARASHLGGVGGQVFSGPVCDSGAYGSNATTVGFNPTTASGGQELLVLVPCQDGLYALQMGSGPSFHLAWSNTSIVPGSPIVAGGAVWVVDPKAGTLSALDPANGNQRFSDQVGSSTRFTTPAAADGRLYVAAGGNLVAYSGI